jgi:hypothetical protein
MKWLTDGKTSGLTTRVRVGVWAKYWRLRPGCGVPEPLPSRPSGTPAFAAPSSGGSLGPEVSL